MSKYTLNNEKVVNTEKAKQCWDEAERWNGNNFISRATGSQWEHETLFLSSKGNFWVEHTSQWQGSLPYAFSLSKEEAVRWLLENEHAIPDFLKMEADSIEE